ncbi:cysteine protease, putative [Plasmodium vivax]|uniref:Serine-repeat antigen 3 (SERA) n=1 Tax=Plasmodium vivax TaxID=5855 RepID=A0A1G4GSY5_PLAVI|nr:cysteine protease, putative [Plasmodium vivax]
MRSRLSVLLLTYAVLNGGILIKAEPGNDSPLPPVPHPPGDTQSPRDPLPNAETPRAEEPQDQSSRNTVQDGAHDNAVQGPQQDPQGPTHQVPSEESSDQVPPANPLQQPGVAEAPVAPSSATETISETSTVVAEQTVVPTPPEASLSSAAPPEASPPSGNSIQVITALLKDANGVKVTGACGAHFELSLVPHISISAETKTNDIKLRPILHKLLDAKEADVGTTKLDNAIQFEPNQEKLKNKCQPGKENEDTFKFLVFIHEGELTLKWKVYNKSAPADASKEVDVRKYTLKNLDQPITTVQVRSSKVDEETLLVESKSYYVNRDIPDKCDVIATDCYLNGNVDIEKCFQCTLLMENSDTTNECFKYVSSQVTDKFKDIKVNAQDEEDPAEVELAASIGKILQGVFKKGEAAHIELLTFDEVDAALKEELLNYCSSMKEVDASGVLDQYQLGSEEDIFANLTSILKNHAGETKSTLQNKLKNPAICLKNADEWVESKKGLLLPSLSHTNGEATPPETPKEDHMSDADEGQQSVPYDAVINLVSAEEKNNQSSLIEDSTFCTEDYCNRWKDDTSCVSKIEAEDQGVCSTSWLFASKVHLETIKCMKGYDHIATSALYVANCSSKEAKDKCHAASNPLEFLDILEETQFLPAESNLPYSYKAVSNACPEPKSHWQNLWENVKLLEKQYEPNAVSTKGYTAYQSDHFKGNMDAFINLVKSQVMSKGSVIAYVKADELMGYDFNGKNVHSLCGSETPNHAVNIIGYGNYVSAEGVKKSYWLLRNSWGKYWGDDGNFKIDMHGADHCQHNFIHTAAVFNLEMPLAQSAAKKDNHLYSYYLKGSPDLYQNMYYKGFGSQGGNAKGGEKGQDGTPVVSGQEGVQEEGDGTSQGEEESLVQLPEEPVDVHAQEGGDRGSAATQDGGPHGAGAKQPLTLQTEQGNEEHSLPGGPEVPGSGHEAGRSGLEAKESEPAVLPSAPGVTPNVPEVPTEVPEGPPSEPGVPSSGPEETQNGPGAAQSEPQVVRSATAVTLSPPEESPSLSPPPSNAAKITQVLHILKHVKQGKVKTRLVTYDSNAAMSADHVCSRAVASDPEKQDECVKFCDDHWNDCKDKISPAYCLTQIRGKKDCFFCYI